MDAGLQRLARAFNEAPHDPEIAADLAVAALRVGQGILALDGARVVGGALHREVADALGRPHGLSLIRVEPTETFRTRDGRALSLVPGGGYLEEGAHAWTSSLEPGASRASLRREVLPPYLISVWPRPARTWSEAADLAAKAGGRLPSSAEWKKGWRGGLYLDGDVASLRPNQAPDRLRPEPHQEPAARLERSVYGLLFPRLGESAEWIAGGTQNLAALPEDGRYTLPAEGITVAGWRLVLELPS